VVTNVDITTNICSAIGKVNVKGLELIYHCGYKMEEKQTTPEALLPNGFKMLISSTSFE